MIWSCVAEYRKNEPSKFPFGNSEVAQKREPPGSLFCFIGNASYEIKTLRLGCAPVRRSDCFQQERVGDAWDALPLVVARFGKQRAGGDE